MKKLHSVLVSGAAVLGVLGILATTRFLAATELGQAPPPQSLVAEAPDGIEPWAADAWLTYATWAGTADEHQAAEVVVAHRLNGDYSECMASEGFSRPWQTSVFPASVYADPLLYSWWAAGRLESYYSMKVVNGEITQRIENYKNAIEAVGEEEAAELSCRKRHPAISDSEVNAVREPAVVEELREAWADALTPLIAAGGSFEAYERCMSGTGVLDRFAVKSTQQVRDYLSAPLPLGSVPLDGESTTATWTAYLADEKAYIDADWDCRKDIRAGLGDEVSKLVADFQRTHADQIQLARQHWENVRAEAATLGWTPTDPYAGANIPSAPRSGP